MQVNIGTRNIITCYLKSFMTEEYINKIKVVQKK